MRSTIAATTVLVLWTTSPAFATTDAQKCAAAQNAALGRYGACVQKTQQKFLAGAETDFDSVPPAINRCQSKYASLWNRALAAGADACAEQDPDGVQNYLYRCLYDVQGILSGDGIPLGAEDCSTDLEACLGGSTCGDGIISGTEECDTSNFESTCQMLGFWGGTLTCNACTVDTSGCLASRFDTSGPTIIDRQTNLEWEKKDAADDVADYLNPHDVDNVYAWSATSTAPDGSVFSDMLARLNGASGGTPYANHTDWRLPNLSDFWSIAVRSCSIPPCVVDAAFLPAKAAQHPTGHTWYRRPDLATYMNFLFGDSGPQYKTQSAPVRAVRNR
jgi:hypothetical protein